MQVIFTAEPKGAAATSISLDALSSSEKGGRGMFDKSRLFVALLSASSVWACVGPTNAAIQAALNKDVSKYKTVSVTVDDCVAVFSGQVEKLSEKLAIARRAKRYDALTAVSNRIVVAVPVVDD